MISQMVKKMTIQLGLIFRFLIVFFFFYLLADIISTVEFDQTGDYLATGDKGGRVVLFERNESVTFSILYFFKLTLFGE